MFGRTELSSRQVTLLAVARRLLQSILSLWLVFTGSFLALSFVRNPNVTSGYPPRLLGGSYAQPRFVAAAEPLLAQYVDWLGRLLTLDLGTVPIRGEAVSATSVVLDAAAVTLLYLGPALAFAVAAGTLLQLLAVVSERGTLDRWAGVAGAAAIAVPVFLVAYLIERYLPLFVFGATESITQLGYNPALGPFDPQNLQALLWPALTMGLYLLAIQLRAAGTDLEGYAEEPFLKVARAKGLGRLRLCRHVFAHSAARLTTVLTSEMLGLVLVGLYVIEWISRTPGFGSLTIDAAASRHPGLVFAVVLLPAGVIAVTNAARESYYTLFDPRVETGD
ncbi:ABC transporter permease subunit [Halococcus saccharolyticus]|uniref:ABC transporter permease n=1 Tax=Halococcus saccharolyticus DSM 5350 TaxID=1227455 RepID=M0MD94_9EURY|nr:ABC transporter permease [Halococcus saccharolyticus]EMA43742.1 ABC transporter permease [Halococcus saccharolyticus DSM 5350]